jgi:hypothetical protein
MEIKNIKEIATLLGNKVTLYAVCPRVSGGRILRNKVLKVDNINNYTYSLGVLTSEKRDMIEIFRRSFSGTYPRDNSIKPEDEINTSARIFTSEEDAKEALKDSVKVLSYKAIESVDRILAKIARDKKKLKEKEDKFKALKNEYYEMSVKRFSK